MNYSFVFFLNSALLGVGLAMDAFSVSLANGLHERPSERCKNSQSFGQLCRLDCTAIFLLIIF